LGTPTLSETFFSNRKTKTKSNYLEACTYCLEYETKKKIILYQGPKTWVKFCALRLVKLPVSVAALSLVPWFKLIIITAKELSQN
jgi:hypothetical protein